jgi:transcriptional regulator with XRE-family HTH domain
MDDVATAISPNFDIHLALRRRLEQTQVQMGLTQKELAQKLGISAPYLNEIMTGRKSGKRKIIDFAKRLDVSVETLTGDQLLIPLMAQVTATAPFRCEEKRSLDFIDIGGLPGISKETARHCYALRVRGNSMMPFQKHGDLFIVEKNSWQRIRPGDKVVLHHRKLSYIRYLELMGETLILRPLSLGLPLQAEPKATLANLDKVVYIIPA